MANKEKIKKGAKKVYSALNQPGAVIAYKAGKKVYEKGKEHGKWANQAKSCFKKARKRGLSRVAAVKLCGVGTKAATKSLKEPKIRR
tara:strand:+ start:102 stop:362 length:261 start_codon:yes stop_codon:yes gene_type:complete